MEKLLAMHMLFSYFYFQGNDGENYQNLKKRGKNVKLQKVFIEKMSVDQ